MFASITPKAMTNSAWCLIISSGIGCGSGIINVYMFLCPVIYYLSSQSALSELYFATYGVRIISPSRVACLSFMDIHV